MQLNLAISNAVNWNNPLFRTETHFPQSVFLFQSLFTIGYFEPLLFRIENRGLEIAEFTVTKRPRHSTEFTYVHTATKKRNMTRMSLQMRWTQQPEREISLELPPINAIMKMASLNHIH